MLTKSSFLDNFHSTECSIIYCEHTEKQPVILSKNIEETGENPSGQVDHMRKHSPVAELL